MRKKNKNQFLEEESIEISLTPLIDTVLVLLIVFIIISPQLESILKVETPQATKISKEKEVATSDLDHYFCVAINQFGHLFGEKAEKITFEYMAETAKIFLKKINQKNKNKMAIIFADKDALLEKVTIIIETLYEIGYERVYLKTKKINFKEKK